MVAISQTC